MSVTVVICTHNRAEKLQHCLDSLNACQRPTMNIDVLVIANACNDNTAHVLRDYQNNAAAADLLPLRWAEEPAAGKSHALNAAIALLESQAAMFVDDDQRVRHDFLLAIERALTDFPQATLYCGRLLPDWTGNEPDWVHNDGKYRIFPPPVASYDMGDNPKSLSADDILPPGGDILVKAGVFTRTGNFSTIFGPRGHDLLGGEDHDFLSRAVNSGEGLQYIPGIVQYHAVDKTQLSLKYLLRKSYQRSRSVTRMASPPEGGIPLYMWRKVLAYFMNAVFSTSRDKTRFYAVRIAAVLGEIRGMKEAGARSGH